MRKLVRDAMTANPRTIDRNRPVVEAAKIMAEEDIGSIPVVDHDQILAGMITDRDIALRVVAEGRDPQATPVGEIATTQVSPAYPEESLNEALESDGYRRVRRLPVIDNDRVVGIRPGRRRARGTGQEGRASGRGDLTALDGVFIP